MAKKTSSKLTQRKEKKEIETFQIPQEPKKLGLPKICNAKDILKSLRKAYQQRDKEGLVIHLSEASDCDEFTFPKQNLVRMENLRKKREEYQKKMDDCLKKQPEDWKKSKKTLKCKINILTERLKEMS